MSLEPRPLPPEPETPPTPPTEPGPLDRLSARARAGLAAGGLLLVALLVALVATSGAVPPPPTPGPIESGVPSASLTPSPTGTFALPEGATRIPAGTRVTALAVDEGGAWAADFGELRVARVGGGSAYALGGTPTQIAAARGVLWVSLSDSGELARVGAGSGSPTRYAAPRGAVDLRVDQSGRAWMLISGEDRVFTADSVSTLTIELRGGPSLLLARESGALVWLANERQLVALAGDGSIGARSDRLPESAGPWLMADAGTRILLADLGLGRLYLLDASDLALLAQNQVELPIIDLVAAEGYAVALRPTGYAVIDLANGKPGSTVSTERIIPGGVIDPRGGVLYLTAPDGGRLLAHDLAQGREVRRWTVGGTLAAPLLDGRGAVWTLDTASSEAVRIAPPGEVLIPTPTPWPSPSATPTPSPTPSESPSEAPSDAPVATPTPIPTPKPTPTPLPKKSQTITFPAQSGRRVGDPPFDPGATASSGLKVSYRTNNPVVCRVKNGLIEILSDGSCTITASQAGNAEWAAAPEKSRTLTVLVPDSLGHDRGGLLAGIALVAA